jgi:hypothetical protein
MEGHRRASRFLFRGENGAGDRNRTRNLRSTTALLYQLSHTGAESRTRRLYRGCRCSLLIHGRFPKKDRGGRCTFRPASCQPRRIPLVRSSRAKAGSTKWRRSVPPLNMGEASCLLRARMDDTTKAVCRRYPELFPRLRWMRPWRGTNRRRGFANRRAAGRFV